MERCSACRPVTFSLVAGELVYKHSGGEVHHYEEQLRTVRRGGSPIFLDDQGSEWSLEQLVVRRATQMA